MRFTIVCVTCLLCSPAFAQPDRWSKLGDLRSGSQIRIDLMNGQRLNGAIETVDDSRLTLRMRDGGSRPFERNAIQSISRKSRGRAALYGLLTGFGIGFITGASAGPYIADYGNPSAGKRAQFGLGFGMFSGGVGAGIGALAGTRVTVYP